MQDVADEAGTLAMTFFASGTTVTLKPDQSPVTEADLAVEQFIRARINERFPDDAIIGEEFGSPSGSAIESMHPTKRTWIVDPIDGTSYFARSDPNWRIHLALQIEERIELAVVAAPALGVRWWAQRGEGAYEATWPDGRNDPNRLGVSARSELTGSLIACATDSARVRIPRSCGVAPRTPLPLVELVRGQIDAFVAEGFYLWDHAPWILIVQEAGGRFTDTHGSESGDRGGGVYSNDRLHDQLVEALGYGSAPFR